jgi:uncharacterized protein with FMN-binding domain
MRRAPVILAATVAGVAGVLTFHSHKPRSTISVGSGAVGPGPAAGPATTTSPPGKGPAGPGPATTAPATTAPAATAPAATAPAAPRSATGSVEQYPYGQLSVTVTEAGGRIASVEMASLSETDARSVMIDDQAIPLLRQQVISAQSANINGVSGATFTSQAYAQSVQSALDQLGVHQ